jgi:hypothetical protein
MTKLLTASVAWMPITIPGDGGLDIVAATPDNRFDRLRRSLPRLS